MDEIQIQKDHENLSPATLNWLHIWRLSLFHPTITNFQRIVRDRKASIAWGGIWMAVSIIIHWFLGPQRVMIYGLVADTFGLQLANGVVWIGGIVMPAFGIIELLLIAGLSHGIAKHFGGTGTFLQLVYVWGVIAVPFALLIEATLHLLFIFHYSNEFTRTHTYLIIVLSSFALAAVAAIYQFYVMMIAFSAVENQKLGRSIGIFLLQSIIIAVIFMIISASLQGLLHHFYYY